VAAGAIRSEIEPDEFLNAAASLCMSARDGHTESAQRMSQRSSTGSDMARMKIRADPSGGNRARYDRPGWMPLIAATAGSARPFHGGRALSSGRQASAARAAIVALAHQTSSSNAAVAEGIRLASIVSIGCFPK